MMHKVTIAGLHICHTMLSPDFTDLMVVRYRFAH